LFDQSKEKEVVGIEPTACFTTQRYGPLPDKHKPIEGVAALPTELHFLLLQ
jgi:hypothetical protein